VAVFLFSGFFTVKPQEQAVLLRFGKPAGGPDGQLLKPGPHWAFPYPIDEVIRIPVGQVQAVNSTVGWYATTMAAEAAGNEPPPGESLDPIRDSYLLTGDENIVHARATLRYRIAEPALRYVLDFANASNLVQNAFDNALIYAAAGFRVDDALTRDLAGFRETVRARMEELNSRHNLGITVDQIDNVRLIPPRQLKAAFDRVLEAEVRRSKDINDARSYENQTVSKAVAEAEARRNAGQTERTRLVEFVAAEVERFTNNLPAFRFNRDLFVQQRQTEVLRVIFTNAVEKTAVPERAEGGKRTLWLQLSREPFKPKPLDQPKEEH
jgi:membrane protease subunit HflK